VKRGDAMDRYAVIGNPVEHSQSPFIHARFAEATGQALRYERLLAGRDEFAATVSRFAAGGALGCNVTVPFKAEAFTLAAQASERARRAGAANTLRFDAEGWFADNTDGVGLVRDIGRNAGVAIAGRRLLLVGAGGAAAGVLGALLEERPAALVLANRTPDKAQRLVEAHAALAHERGVALRAAPLDDCGAGHDIVVNATASSLLGAAPPVDAAVLRPGTLALDLMYGPAARGFLAWALRHGAIGRDGLGMLVEQAAEAFHLWRGVRPATAPVLAALQARLASPAAR
jgi:shikimate dehydrogenase